MVVVEQTPIKTIPWTEIDTKNQIHNIHQCLTDLRNENTQLKESNTRLLCFVNNLGNDFIMLKKRFELLESRLRGQVF